MNQERAARHTALNEREDEPLEHLDACYRLLAATWQFLQVSDEPIHVPTVRRLILALRAIERSIDDELLDVRLGIGHIQFFAYRG